MLVVAKFVIMPHNNRFSKKYKFVKEPFSKISVEGFQNRILEKYL